MRSYFPHLLIAATSLTLALFTATPHAQSYQEPLDSSEEAGFEGPVRAGTLDFTLAVGGILYNRVEVGADLGLIPIGNSFTISLGGYINAGYCLLGCELFNWIFAPLNLRAWHVNPMARAAVHFNFLSELLDLHQFNIYAGLTAGPSFYDVALTVDNDPAEVTLSQTTFLFGPLLGLRLTLSGTRGFFLFGEARMLAEFGFEQASLRTSDGQLYTADSSISRSGEDVAVGVGFRF